MKLKAIFASIAFTILTAITLSQVIGVSAQSVVQKPLTSPVTSPSPTPTITPTPSPITAFSFVVGGRVEYRFLNLLGKVINILPAKNITVKAINKATDKVKTVKTNGQGNYSITLEKGTYKIQAIDVNNTLFTPNNLTIKVLSNIKGLDFSKDFKASPR